MIIKDIIKQMNDFDANTLAIICYFGGAFSANYYRKIVDIKEIDITPSKSPTHQNNNEHRHAICFVASELISNISKIISVNDILFMLSKFDKSLDLYCINDDFNINPYSFLSEISCIIDGNRDPDLKEFRELNKECNIVEIVV